MLDAHQLNVFLVATETLNFTKAAQSLHMSQPSVSQHIHALERLFNTELFVRTGRNLQLTDAGLSLVPLARDMVKQSIRIEETMASLQGEVYGHLLVACSTTPGKYVLPQLLASFHRIHPNVKVTCKVSPQPQAIEMLCEGQVHIALASIGQETCHGAEFRKFMVDQVVLIAPSYHPWAQRGEIKPEELYSADFILREEESGTFAVVDEALTGIGISINILDTLLILGNAEAIALALQEGLGVGFVSSIVVTRLGQKKITPIKVTGLNICRDIHIGRHTRRSATAAQTAFWNFINEKKLPFINDQQLEISHNEI